MSRDKNVLVTLTVVILFALIWIAMYPVMDAWAAREAGRYTVVCEPGYNLEFLDNGGLKVVGDCKGVEPARPDEPEETQEPVYDSYPMPGDPPYPYIENPCDYLWLWGQECNP